jgi:hypothetical protein
MRLAVLGLWCLHLLRCLTCTPLTDLYGTTSGPAAYAGRVQKQGGQRFASDA